jgi:predicted DNA-binding protein (MmcQ/YjbR family)
MRQKMIRRVGDSGPFQTPDESLPRLHPDRDSATIGRMAKKPKDPLDVPEAALAKIALTYPDVTEDHPWGERAFKIKGKVFLFLSRHEGRLNATVKLPQSNAYALTQPFAKPTGYNMGKHGWVTNRFVNPNDVPLDLLEDWIAESFRAVAPKTVVAKLDGPNPR